MREQEIRDELDNDPNGHGYAAIIGGAGPDDIAVNQLLTDELNLADISRNRANLTRDEIVNSIDPAELTALTNAVQAANVWGVIGEQGADPFGIAQQIFVDAFGPGSVTVLALQALRIEQISRGTELGLGKVKPGHVQMARNLP